MNKSSKDTNWVEIIEKFSTYNGKIVDFCKENNIMPQQLYRQRKKLNQVPTQTFHAIDISTPAAMHGSSEKIKIEVGNAKIYIPQGDTAMLIYILKELSIC